MYGTEGERNIESEGDKNRPKGMSQIEGTIEEMRERVGEVRKGCKRRRDLERKEGEDLSEEIILIM